MSSWGLGGPVFCIKVTAMAKTRHKKETEAAGLAKKFQRMSVAVFSSTAGLKVKDVNTLRSTLRAAGIDHRVAKKTIIRRALASAGLEKIDLGAVTESFSVTFGYADEVAPAQLLAQFAKTHESLKFLGGIMGGTFMTAERVQALSRLPSRDELRGQLVGTIAAPLSGFVSVLVGNVRGLVRTIDGYRQQRVVTGL